MSSRRMNFANFVPAESFVIIDLMIFNFSDTSKYPIGQAQPMTFGASSLSKQLCHRQPAEDATQGAA